MRIVLVGGSGFIGTNVSKRLQDLGYEVVNVSRSGKGSAGARGVEYEHLPMVIDGAKAVINLAGANMGAKRWTGKRRRKLVESRLEPTRAIVEAIADCKVRPALVSMTGIGYYGNTSTPCNEAMGHGKTFMALLSKAWEDEANKAKPLTRVAILRTGPLLETNDGPLGRMLPFVKNFVGGVLGSGRQYIPWIHRDDAVDAIVWAATTETAEGPYNVTAPEMVTMRTFVKTLGKVLHRPTWLPVPQFVLYLVFGTMADTVDDSVPAYPMRLLGTDFAFRFPTLEGALRNLLGRENEDNGNG